MAQENTLHYRFNQYGKRILINLPVSKKKVYMIASGRSGTTWISEVINYRNNFRDILEPFRSDRAVFCEGLPKHPYFSSTKDNTYAKKVYRKIMTGRVLDKWIDRLNTKWFTRKLLIKSICGHFITDWLIDEYPEMKTIYLMRHPFAVAHSKFKITGQWDPTLMPYIEHEELIDTYFPAQKEFIKQAHTPFESFIIGWCIENYVGLKQIEGKNVHLITYEDFCLEPEKEVKDLFEFINEDFTDKALEQLKVPSRTTYLKNSDIKTGSSLIDGWQRKLSEEEIKSGLKILKMFGMDKIYNESLTPTLEAVKTLGLPVEV